MDHIDFNSSELRNSLVKNCVYVTSLRHPLGRLSSHLNFGASKKGLKRNSSFNLLELFFSQSEKSNYLHRKKDPGAVYVSVPKEFQNHSSKTGTFVKRLGSFFKVVLITEYFDESLLLMKRLLCWDLKDILYLRLKLGNYTYKTKIYPAEMLEKHKRMVVNCSFDNKFLEISFNLQKVRFMNTHVFIAW